MPDIVTFDPDALTITEINSGLSVNETDLVEIYSEWKAWVLGNPQRAGYPSAFRQVGSDPISDLQNLGTTFFLTGGWKFKPAEYNHTWQINGNIFTEPAGLQRTTPVDGAFTVEVTFFVSNLVDSAVARLDLDQLLQSIYIDPVNGVAGTADGVGTPTNPSNNIADAYTIAVAKNLSSFHVRGSITLDRNYSNWTFLGEGNYLNNNISLGGFDVDGCFFHRVNLDGTMTGRIEADSCGLDVLVGLDGVFTSCGLVSNFSIDANSVCIFRNCFSEVAGASSPICTVGANAVTQFRNFSGGVELKGMTAGVIGSVDLDPGTLTLNADCTGGALLVRGVGVLTDNSGNVTLTTSGLINTDVAAAEVHNRGKLLNPIVLKKGPDFDTEV